MNGYYCLLEQEALLHITGPDSLKFLQGQTTCDTRKIDSGHGRPGIYCTPQGRVVCDFLLCELEPEHFVLRLRRDIRESSSAVFAKYAIFSKVTLEPQRDDRQVFGIWGDEAASVLRKILTDLPEEQYATHSVPGLTLIQTDTDGQAFECYVDAAANADFLAQLQEQLQTSTERQWQALQIARGIARIESKTVEEFVPQTLNYDLTDHISFNKGCYTGQEVVARLHYRGTPKRRTYLATLAATEQQFAAGTVIFQTGQDKGVGHVVNAVPTENGTVALVATTTSGIDDQLHLESAEGPVLTIGELPYTLPQA